MRRILAIAVVAPMVVVVAAANPAPAAIKRTCRGHVATIVGTPGDDKLTGTRKPDVIVALGGKDTLTGLGGDDVLCGGPGADNLFGGNGNDRLYGGQDQYEQRRRRTVVTGDLLEGGRGDDHLAAGFDPWDGRVLVRRQDTISFRHSTRAVTVDLRERTVRGEGADVIARGPALMVEGSRYDDSLRGSPGKDILDGLRGDDLLRGRGGDDVLLDYAGNDELYAGPAEDLVISTRGVDTVAGGDGGDWLIAASPATSTLLGGPGTDYMARQITPGETGPIDGGPDRNQLELEPQLWFDLDVTSSLDAAAQTAVMTAEGRMHTTTFSRIHDFTLWGGHWSFLGTERDDFVQVLDGPLNAQGFAGNDIMFGGELDDVLDGGDGTDTAWGGEGSNTCIDVEAGSCTGYPWDDTSTRARAVGESRKPLSALPPHRLVSRWLSGRSLLRDRVTGVGS